MLIPEYDWELKLTVMVEYPDEVFQEFIANFFRFARWQEAPEYTIEWFSKLKKEMAPLKRQLIAEKRVVEEARRDKYAARQAALRAATTLLAEERLAAQG